MRPAKFILPVLVAMLAATHSAGAQNEWWNNDPSYVTPIEEAAVVARRPLGEIGQQKTELDSAALKLTVSQSMADVLTFNSSIFVKQYGRGSLSTVSFRGTAASHTQVTWNGMKINSPMLGMTDFSMIPSFFTDKASLLHGSSSLVVAGGGLGGAVLLATAPEQARGWQLDAVLGAGSFSTWDGFLKLGWGNSRWQLATRAAGTLSKNDFTYRNYKKKEYTYDAAGIPTGSYYPIDTNRCGSIRDVHLMQEAYYKTDAGDRLSVNAWWTSSVRGVPLLSVDYRQGSSYTNLQSENTLRLVCGWNHTGQKWLLDAKAGWLHTSQGYDFARDKGNGTMAKMIESRSLINTFHAAAQAKWFAADHLMVEAQLAAYQHFVKSQDRNAISRAAGDAGGGRRVQVGRGIADQHGPGRRRRCRQSRQRRRLFDDGGVGLEGMAGTVPQDGGKTDVREEFPDQLVGPFLELVGDDGQLHPCPVESGKQVRDPGVRTGVPVDMRRIIGLEVGQAGIDIGVVAAEGFRERFPDEIAHAVADHRPAGFQTVAGMSVHTHGMVDGR